MRTGRRSNATWKGPTSFALILVLLGMTSSPLYGSSMILEDFTDSAKGRWEYISDEVMGGVSDGRVEFIEESNVQFVRLRGVVSTENNGGFIQARRKLNNLPSSTNSNN